MFNDPHWTSASHRLSRGVVEAVNRLMRVVTFEPARTSVRVLRLPFYAAHQLYELSINEGLQQAKAFAVYDGSEHIQLLDWNSHSIYILNNKAPLVLPDCDDPQMAATVCAYLRFFSNFLEADQGPFFLVEQPDDLPLAVPLSPESSRRIEPVSLTACVPGQHYDLRAVVLYGGRLFDAELRVHAQPVKGAIGYVEMLHDTTLELDVTVIPRLAQKRGAVKFLIERRPPVPISAREFREELDRGHQVSNRIVLDENIDFRSMLFSLPVVVRNCVFRGGMDLSLAHFDRSVEFVDCEIDGCFVATGAQINGSLSLAGTRIHGRDPSWRSDALMLTNATIKGDLNLPNADIEGPFDGTNITVEKQVTISGVHVAGYLSLTYARLAGLSCSLDGSRRALVEGDLEIGGVECHGYMRIEGMKIGGALRAISSRLGTLFLCHGWLESGAQDPAPGPTGESPTTPRKRACPVDIGQGVYFDNTTFSGRLSCTGMQIAGEMHPQSPDWVQRRPGAFMLNDCHVAGDVALTAIRAHESASVGEIPEDELRQPQIKGDVILTGTEVDGEIDLRGLSCGGAVTLGGARAGSNVRCDASGGLTTTCAAFEMEQFTCDGDIQLSGLRLVDVPPDADARAGHVNGRACTVGGQLSLFDLALNSRDPESGFTRIPGSLNLTNASAGHLILSGHSFEKSGDPPHKAGIVFQHATFRRFQLHSPPLPTSLDLSNVSVEWWDFGNHDQLQIFEHLLREDLHKYRSTFLSIERSLFNQGSADSAEQVRRLMYNNDRGGAKFGRRSVPRSTSLPQSAGYAFWEWFGYGRTRFLLLLFLGALLCNGLLYSARENIWPTLSALEAHETWTQEDIPGHWTIADAFWVSLQRQVPMIELGVKEEWRPARRRLTLPLLDVTLPVMTAEHWGGFVSLVAWIWWPLLLLSVSGVVRRAGLNQQG